MYVNTPLKGGGSSEHSNTITKNENTGCEVLSTAALWVRLQPRVVYRAVYLQMKTQETLPVTTSHVIIKRIISVQGYSCL